LSDDLTLDEVKRILSEAEKVSLRDALVFKLMAGYGLSVGEIVGTPARRWDEATRKWFAMEPSLSGLQIEDLDKEGILVRRKMGRPTEKIRLKAELVRELTKLIRNRTKGKIFELSQSRVEQLARTYSKKAGVLEGKLRPQMLIDYFRKNQGSPLMAETVSLSETRSRPEPVSPSETGRQVGRKIEYPGLTYAPINEYGVIFLFSMMNRDDDFGLGFSVESIAGPFPDALVVDYRKNRERGMKKYIEFEFSSSNFWRQKHDTKRCDIIVCWEHDWKDCPLTIEVIELKKMIEQLKLRTVRKHES
jgi:hypothetical protein